MKRSKELKVKVKDAMKESIDKQELDNPMIMFDAQEEAKKVKQALGIVDSIVDP